MEKRLILAIVLSVVVIMTFQHMTVRNAPKVMAPGVSEVSRVSGSTAASYPTEETVIREEKVPPIQEKEHFVDSDNFVLALSNIGGAIKGIQLKDHNDLKTNDYLHLVNIENPNDYIFAISDTSGGVLPGLKDYKVIGKNGAAECILRAEDFEITKRYVIPKDKQYIELQLVIKNTSSTAKSFTCRIIGGAGVSEFYDQDKRYIEATSKVNGKTLGFKKPRKDERIINPGIVTWTTLKNKYFSLVLKPLATTKAQFCKDSKSGGLVVGVDSETITIQPGSSIENNYILYAGPSSIPILKAQGYGLEETVNYGFFGGISKALIAVLKFFYSIVRNWGLSIILLSIFLNIILFPLTMKSFKSMQKMQELHPQMEKLKAENKNNPQKLNKEMMELYKKYNINPLSGCLPMLLQMPIFIALYQALIKSIELRGAHFLWIKDLSSPEAIPIPMSFPIIGNTINILPLIMVAAMVVQQKISTKSMGSAVTDDQKQQQKMMLIMMPIVFGFIFYNMPSGLVLYWVVNTTLTIIEQGVILKKPD